MSLFENQPFPLSPKDSPVVVLKQSREGEQRLRYVPQQLVSMDAFGMSMSHWSIELSHWKYGIQQPPEGVVAHVIKWGCIISAHVAYFIMISQVFDSGFSPDLVGCTQSSHRLAKSLTMFYMFNPHLPFHQELKCSQIGFAVEVTGHISLTYQSIFWLYLHLKRTILT